MHGRGRWAEATGWDGPPSGRTGPALSIRSDLGKALPATGSPPQTDNQTQDVKTMQVFSKGSLEWGLPLGAVETLPELSRPHAPLLPTLEQPGGSRVPG